MTTPLSKGLFERAIGESGSVILAGQPLTLQQAEKRGETLAAAWKIPAGASPADLRAVSVADILKAEPPYLSPEISNVFPNLGITIDGYVFAKAPADVFAEGKEHRVALLHGNNSREWLPGSRPPDDLSKAIEESYGRLAGPAQKLYVGEPDPLYGTPVNQWDGDTSFRCSAVAELAWHSAAGNSSYEYEFVHVPAEARKPGVVNPSLQRFSFGASDLGAVHASEVSYVLGTLDRGIDVFYSSSPIPATPVDWQVSEVMQQYWTNFAKTGDPNGPGLPTWPKFDPSSRAYVQFTDAGPVAKEGLRRRYCDLFIQNVERLMAK